MAKKKLPTTSDELLNRKEIVLVQLLGESDRGAILVGTSILEECLEMLLRANLSAKSEAAKKSTDQLLSTPAPLSSFWAKIHLSYTMDLIETWIFKDLEVIRQLRNLAAHQYVPISFDDVPVIRLTEQLEGADHAVTAIEKSRPTSRSSDKQPQRSETKKERMRFILSVSWIAGTLEERARSGKTQLA